MLNARNVCDRDFACASHKGRIATSPFIRYNDLEVFMGTHAHLTARMQNIERMKPQAKKKLKLDEIGEWSELKLDILKKYAGAYCTILKARNLHPVYIDAFAGAGTHIRKGTNELVLGSPLNALRVQPPFDALHLIDLDQTKVAELKRHTHGLKHVHVYGGNR